MLTQSQQLIKAMSCHGMDKVQKYYTYLSHSSITPAIAPSFLYYTHILVIRIIAQSDLWHGVVRKCFCIINWKSLCLLCQCWTNEAPDPCILNPA